MAGLGLGGGDHVLSGFLLRCHKSLKESCSYCLKSGQKQTRALFLQTRTRPTSGTHLCGHGLVPWPVARVPTAWPVPAPTALVGGL